MKMITNGRGNRKHKVATKKFGGKNFTIGEELNPKEKSKLIIRRLKLEAAEAAVKLQEAKSVQNDLERRSREDLIWKCRSYSIRYKDEEIRRYLQVLDEQPDAEMQLKRNLLEVNLSHKLKQGMKRLAEEMRNQRTTAQGKREIPWGLINILKSKESLFYISEIMDYFQVIYPEVPELGQQKGTVNRGAQGLQTKFEAVAINVGSLQGKLEDINCRIKQVSTYMLQLENASLNKKQQNWRV